MHKNETLIINNDPALVAYLDQIERLDAERRTIADDIREKFAEAKGNGYDTKAMRQILKLRRMDAAERAEQEALVEVYKAAVGLE